MHPSSSRSLQTFMNIRALGPGSYYRRLHVSPSRYYSQPPYARPGPPPLPREEQREFEELVRNAQAPAAATSTGASNNLKSGEELHPDARRPIPAEFVGNVNPVTGERGGPKQEPVPEGRNDWSFGGRVTDF